MDYRKKGTSILTSLLEELEEPLALEDMTMIVCNTPKTSVFTAKNVREWFRNKHGDWNPGS